jgi:hypothetical protein
MLYALSALMLDELKKKGQADAEKGVHLREILPILTFLS